MIAFYLRSKIPRKAISTEINMTEETNKAFCQECGEELELNPRTPCPNCGSQKRNFDVKAHCGLTVAASVSGDHKQKMSGIHIGILSILITVWLAIINIISVILPFSPLVNRIVGLTAILLSVLVYCFQKYRITKFIRWIEKNIGGQKTFKN